MDNPYSGCDPLGLMPKYTKEELADKTTDKVIELAREGRMKKAGNYHADTGHGFSDQQVLGILKNPDAVYRSTGTADKLIFRKGNDIVVVVNKPAGAGNVITAYGESGIKGDSGAQALGGDPGDPGAPVTHDDVIKGRIPAKNGFVAPARRIR